MLGVYWKRRNTDYYSLFRFLLNLQQTEPNWPLNSTDTRDLTAQKGRLHAVQFFAYTRQKITVIIFMKDTYSRTSQAAIQFAFTLCDVHTANFKSYPTLFDPCRTVQLAVNLQDCGNGTECSRPSVYPSHMGWTVDAGVVLEHVVSADLKSLAWETGAENAKIPCKIIWFI